MNEFIEQFLIESRELVEQGTQDLLALEQAPDDKARLDSAFRAFHTLKGAAGIVDFLAMGRLLHGAEDILSAARAGDRPVTADLISDGLACLDQVVQWLDAIEAGGEVPDVSETSIEGLLARFERPETSEAPVATAQSLSWVDDLRAAYPAEQAAARVAIRYEPDRDCFFRGDDPLGLIALTPDLLAVSLTPNQPWPTLDEMDPFACNLVILALSAAAPEDVADALRTVAGQVRIERLAELGDLQTDRLLSSEARAVLENQLLLLTEPDPDGRAGRIASAARTAANVLRHAGHGDLANRLVQAGENERALAETLRGFLSPPTDQPGAQPPLEAAAPQDVAARGLRVGVERIDALVKLTDELTVVKNALGHATRLAQEGVERDVLAQTLKGQHALLERLINELQQSVLGIRVLPLRNLFQRFPKVVREIAASLGKSVRLVTAGDVTEADKAVVEALFEPLLHVVRNALDHGVEPPEARLAAGKSEVATVRLRAAREGEHVIVEVADDGRGVDLDRVREVAAARGVASPDALAEMTNDDLIDLIFAPGFSTAAAITDVSGRGVGMDAVRSAIARLGGRVSIVSRMGEGAAVTFTLPFTLMMSRVMTVEVAGQTLGIPFEAVQETLRLPRAAISSVGAAQAIVSRDRTIPLIALAEALGLTPERVAQAADANILVVNLAGQLAALEVDRFGERLDIMLKPMEGLLAGLGGVAGTTLLGDGRVLIVLDVQGLLQ